MILYLIISSKPFVYIYIHTYIYIYADDGPEEPKRFGTAVKVGAINTYTLELGWFRYAASPLLLKLSVVYSPLFKQR